MTPNPDRTSDGWEVLASSEGAPQRCDSRVEPCPTCPWRRSSTVGGADIPGFELAKMRGLVNTVGAEDAFRPIMACHYSTFAAEDYACVGYVAREGWSNLAVRVAVIEGRIDLTAIDAACQGIDLWPDFASMLAAYEQAAEPPSLAKDIP